MQIFALENLRTSVANSIISIHVCVSYFKGLKKMQARWSINCWLAKQMNGWMDGQIMDRRLQNILEFIQITKLYFNCLCVILYKFVRNWETWGNQLLFPHPSSLNTSKIQSGGMYHILSNTHPIIQNSRIKWGRLLGQFITCAWIKTVLCKKKKYVLKH